LTSARRISGRIGSAGSSVSELHQGCPNKRSSTGCDAYLHDGKEAENIFKTFQLNDEEANKYKTVKDRFEAYFIDRRNTVFKICRFRTCRQKCDESAELFITRLYTLPENCM
jgi:hypothetical protein